MKTEKLYYKSAYIKEFTAKVVSCEKKGDVYEIVLDKTAFFPEEGGQYADSGYIDGIRVLDVKERAGVIYHTAEMSIETDKEVACSLEFEERLEKMRIHSAEHILSGILHTLYGIENTGFHLGKEDVTFDTSRPISREMLKNIERLANLAVMRNMPITAEFPSAEELKNMTYRSKLDLTEDVRIVTIGDVDACACCAPHVAYTGEIGVIKLIDAVTHRGGSRIRMLAGERALDYISCLSDEASRVSVMLSAPVLGISSETETLLGAKDELKYKLSEANKKIARLLAESLADNISVVLTPFSDKESLRFFVNEVTARREGDLVALFGEEGRYTYLIHSERENFKEFIKAANAALSGKGGGKAPAAEGMFSATLEEIKAYFASTQ